MRKLPMISTANVESDNPVKWAEAFLPWFLSLADSDDTGEITKERLELMVATWFSYALVRGVKFASGQTGAK